MPSTLDQKTALRLLQQNGWKRGERARHGIKMEAPGQRPVTLPRFRGRPYPKGLNHDIIKQAGLNPKEVRAWISRSKSIKRDRDTGRTL